MLLTKKQLRFINEYLVDENGTQAAIRAGYSRRTARSIASENLKKPRISGTIERYRLEAGHHADADRKRIVHMLARLAFADISGIFNPNRSLKHPNVWPSSVMSKIGRSKIRSNSQKRVKRRAAAETSNTSAKRIEALGALASYLNRNGLLDA